MSLHEKIKADMVQAMKDRKEVRVSVLRGLMAAFNNELLSKKGAGDLLSDEDANTMIMRAIKQRRDSIEQFKKGGRADLVEIEETELKVVEEYAPKLMPAAEVAELAKKKQAEMGITDRTKMGMLMGALMKDLKGKADGADVKAAVEGLFQ